MAGHHRDHRYDGCSRRFRIVAGSKEKSLTVTQQCGALSALQNWTLHRDLKPSDGFSILPMGEDLPPATGLKAARCWIHPPPAFFGPKPQSGQDVLTSAAACWRMASRPSALARPTARLTASGCNISPDAHQIDTAT